MHSLNWKFLFHIISNWKPSYYVVFAWNRPFSMNLALRNRNYGKSSLLFEFENFSRKFVTSCHSVVFLHHTFLILCWNISFYKIFKFWHEKRDSTLFQIEKHHIMLVLHEIALFRWILQGGKEFLWKILIYRTKI